MAARNSLQVGLVVLALLCLHSTHCQVTMLVQVNPPEGDPVCWNSPLTFNCTVKAAQLIWGYTGMGVGPVAFFADDTSGIGQLLSLGPFNVTLLSAVMQNETAVMTSVATITTEITDAIDGQSISCQGTQEELITISITELQIDNAAFCNSTVSWSPPPCDANCTVSVDGQDTGPVPCMNGRLDTSFSTLITRAVMLTAVDGVGRSTTTEVSVDSSADCIKVPPVTLVSLSSGGACEDSEHLMYMVEDASLVYIIVDVESGDTIHPNFSVSEPTFSFEAKCGRSYELQVNDGLVIDDIKAKSCTGFHACVIVPVVLSTALVSLVVGIAVLIVCKRRWKKGRGQESGYAYYRKLGGQELPLEIVDKKSYDDHKCPITHCAVSSDARYIASVDEHAVLRIWKDACGSEQSTCKTVHIQNMKIQGGFFSKSRKVGAAGYSKDGGMECLVSLNWVDGTVGRQLMLAYNTVVMIHDVTASAVRIVFSLTKKKKSPFPRVFCAACSPPDTTFAVSFTNNLNEESVHGRVMLGQTNPSSKQRDVELAGNGAPIVCMSFSQSGRFLAAGNHDGDVELYDCRNPTSKPRLWKLHNEIVRNLQFDVNDKKRVYFFGKEDNLCLLDLSKEDGKKCAKYDQTRPDLFDQEPNAQENPTKIFEYFCRSELFKVGFENTYILNAFPNGVIYEVYGDFRLHKVQTLCDDKTVTCVDWVATAQDNITTCVMGCSDGSVKIVKLRCKTKEVREDSIAEPEYANLQPMADGKDVELKENVAYNANMK